MNESPPLPLRVGAKAHPGKVREENQDRISRFRSPFGEVFIVADGMGGHEGGAMAAQLLVNGLESHLCDMPPQMPPAQALQTAASRVNAAIYERASSGDPKTSKMGSTGVLALVNGLRVLIAHAGDSRAYLLRDGRLTPLTRDHTVVQRMLDSNMLNEEEARHHPDASVITRAFGQKPEVELEISEPFDLREGDLLMLCSDGLCGYVEDTAIQHVLQSGGDAQAITDALIELALQAGGEDNVSVQLLATESSVVSGQQAVVPVSSRLPAPTTKRRLLLPLAIGLLVLAAFATGALFPWRKWISRETKNQKQEETPAGLSEKKGDPAGKEPEPAERKLLEVTQLPGRDNNDQVAPINPNGPGAGLGGKVEGEGNSAATEASRLAEETRMSLPDLIANLGGILLPTKSLGFEEGWVYYRPDSRKQADQLVTEINKNSKAGARYRMRPWPEALNGRLSKVPLLVVLHPTPKERIARPALKPPDTPKASDATPSAPKQEPIILVVIAAGTPLPKIPPDLADKYPANWQGALELPEPKMKGLSVGSVYSRRPFNVQAGEIANALKYSHQAWLPSFDQRYRNADIVIVLKPAVENEEVPKEDGIQP